MRPTRTARAGGSLLDEIVRDGARQMLAAALQAEVAAYVDAHADEVDEDGSSAGGPQRLPRRAGGDRPPRGRCRCGRRGSTTSASTPRPVNGSGSPRRSCRRGRASPRRWPRCCRCCTCTACRRSDFGPALEQFLGLGRGPVGGDDHPADRAVARRGRGVQQAARCRAPTTSTCGSTASTSRSAWSRTRCACW